MFNAQGKVHLKYAVFSSEKRRFLKVVLAEGILQNCCYSFYCLYGKYLKII